MFFVPLELHYYIANFLPDNSMVQYLSCTSKLYHFENANFWRMRCQMLQVDASKNCNYRQVFFQFKSNFALHLMATNFELQLPFTRHFLTNKVECKIIMIGAINVGKSTLARRLVLHNDASDFHIMPTTISSALLQFSGEYQGLQIQYDIVR